MTISTIECNEPRTGRKWCQHKRFKDNFKNWTGGFGKIYSAVWPEGYIHYWDIINQQWRRIKNIKSHFQIYLNDIIRCYGITQDPNTKVCMMVLRYCNYGNLRNYYLNQSDTYNNRIKNLSQIVRGLLDIHNAEKVHKDFHSGNILNDYDPLICDLGMCQPTNEQSVEEEEGIYGVLPYVSEVLRGLQYTKASNIYSFGIIMNEYNDIPHDHVLAVKICKGFRPIISEDTPKLLADLINKCWDAEAENRPTAKELYQILKKWSNEIYNKDSEIYSQIEEFTSIIQSTFVSKWFDCQLSESDHNQEDENNTE
ncbi:kinase-like domain-containing protein [Glomus cerebriforme]|uniref:Kinase-like domain-containing protein n=1 Tax=Glomus cerebriforme TaxID=658196 RepID=A0A397SCS3_9GLOM|nr:kinase-like domain-containing protein [Glomus cerebriforme]